MAKIKVDILSSIGMPYSAKKPYNIHADKLQSVVKSLTLSAFTYLLKSLTSENLRDMQMGVFRQHFNGLLVSISHIEQMPILNNSLPPHQLTLDSCCSPLWQTADC